MTLKPMPHGSDESPGKNCNEIPILLCMPLGRDKLW